MPGNSRPFADGKEPTYGFVFTPMVERAERCREAIYATRSVGSRLLVACSGETRAGDVMAYARAAQTPCTVINLPTQELAPDLYQMVVPESSKFWISHFGRTTDLDIKRNLAMLLAAKLGMPWLSLDSDIYCPPPAMLTKMLALLDSHDAVSVPIELGVPDNSLTYQIWRDLGRELPAFAGMGLQASRAVTPGGICQPNYGDDKARLLGILMSGGSVLSFEHWRQERYDIFDSARGRPQELADGLFDGLETLSPEALRNGSQEDLRATISKTHEDRLNLLATFGRHVTSTLRRLDNNLVQLSPEKEIRQRKLERLKRGLDEAWAERSAVDSEKIEVLTEYVLKFRDGLPAWNELVKSLAQKPADSIQQALEHLALNQFAEHYDPPSGMPRGRTLTRQTSVSAESEPVSLPFTPLAKKVATWVSATQQEKNWRTRGKLAAQIEALIHETTGGDPAPAVGLASDPEFLHKLGLQLDTAVLGPDRYSVPSARLFLEATLRTVEAGLPKTARGEFKRRASALVTSALKHSARPHSLQLAWVHMGPRADGTDIAVALVPPLTESQVEPRLNQVSPLFLTVPTTNTDVEHQDSALWFAAFDGSAIPVSLHGSDPDTMHEVTLSFLTRQHAMMRRRESAAGLGLVVNSYEPDTAQFQQVSELAGKGWLGLYAAPSAAEKLNAGRSSGMPLVRPLVR